MEILYYLSLRCSCCKKGTKVFACDEVSFRLVNGLPFRSLRATI